MKLKVNGEEAPEGVLEAEISSLMGRFRQLSEEQLQQYGFTTPEAMRDKAMEWGRENIVERMLLQQEAMKDEEPVPAEALDQAVERAVERVGGPDKFEEAGLTEADARRDAEAEIKRERLIHKLTAHIKAPKTKEIAEFYRKHKDQFLVPESINASHILKSVNEETSKDEALKAIQEAKAELDAGAEFADVADRLSDAPSEGGDLGWFPPGRMVPRFDEAAFSLQPGETSDIFKTTFGYHIVRVVDRRPEKLTPLSEVREMIERQLKGQQQNEILENFVDKLREKAEVKFTPDEN